MDEFLSEFSFWIAITSFIVLFFFLITYALMYILVKTGVIGFSKLSMWFKKTIKPVILVTIALAISYSIHYHYQSKIDSENQMKKQIQEIGE